MAAEREGERVSGRSAGDARLHTPRSFPPTDLGNRLTGVLALGELFDRLLAERWQVIRLATGDQPFIANTFLVYPLRPGIDQVGL